MAKKTFRVGGGGRFERRKKAIARGLEGTKGPAKYAGRDRRYSEREAERSAEAITAAAGRKKYGKKAFAEMSAAGRKRARQR